jgi:Alcohol dehydrogenase GroES-like domain
MKAIRVREFGGAEVLRLEEVPTPQPGLGQVLVRMHAIGVNPVETYIRAGTYALKPTLPYTPGNDGAGVVEQVGMDVNEFKSGDRVYTAGSIGGTLPSLRCAKRRKCIRCRRMFLSPKVRPWALRTRPRIAGCSSAPTRSWRDGASARRERGCRDGGRATGACSRSARVRYRGQ